jgi:hypothetical protein
MHSMNEVVRGNTVRDVQYVQACSPRSGRRRAGRDTWDQSGIGGSPSNRRGMALAAPTVTLRDAPEPHRPTAVNPSCYLASQRQARWVLAPDRLRSRETRAGRPWQGGPLYRVIERLRGRTGGRLMVHSRGWRVSAMAGYARQGVPGVEAPGARIQGIPLFRVQSPLIAQG